jgi:murein DD-endopeptidase MepM/ murein hydrolase activator NlpD
VRRLPGLAVLLAAVVACATGLTVTAHAAPSAAEKKQRVDDKLRAARERLERTRAAERAVQAAIGADTAEIRQLSVRLERLHARLDRLQERLAPARRRLAELRKVREEANVRLAALEASQLRVREVATERLVAMYRNGEPDPVAVMLSGDSIAGAFEALREMQRIADADQQLFSDLGDAERNVTAERTRAQSASQALRAAAADLFDEEAEVERQTDEASGVFERLEARRADRRDRLAKLSGDRHEVEAETKRLEQESAALTRKILQVTLEADGVRVPRSAGALLWPCNGGITSNFGYRWGRMHEGLDIGCSYGSTIVAAAPGTIIYAGPQGGYGNIILIQHSPSLVTAYAHQSSFIRTSGHVEAGTPIGRVGSTGHSTGPHLHFETRVNGAPQDPLRFL